MILSDLICFATCDLYQIINNEGHARARAHAYSTLREKKKHIIGVSFLALMTLRNDCISDCL